jgi:hypothetical protein
MTHNQEVMSSNPGTVYWMDVSDAKLLHTIRIMKNQGSQMGHTKKIKKYKYIYISKTVEAA